MPRVASLLWLLPLAVLASCASNSESTFDQHWKDTPPPMNANPAAMMAGKWEGTWQSDSTDYNGHLQSIITFTAIDVKNNEPVQTYDAHFQLRLFEVPFNDYAVTLTANKLPDGRIHFTGKKDLGFYMGGIFVYDGYVYPGKDEFYCDYNSDKDCGTFKMRRIIQSLQKENNSWGG